MQINPYDERYSSDDLYWGSKPSAMACRLVELMPPGSGRALRLLDLGCGEGRNALYFAKKGYQVIGFDSSETGLDKAVGRVQREELVLSTIRGDIKSHNFEGSFDILFSTGTLHYIPPDIRAERYEHFRDITAPGGLNAFTVFVERPFIPPAPDAELTAHLYRSGELFGFYRDWEIIDCAEEVFDCNSSGVPHRHAVNRLIARKPV